MKAITKILLLAAVMAVFIMLPMKVQAATHDVSTLEDLKTVIASVYSGDTVNIFYFFGNFFRKLHFGGTFGGSRAFIIKKLKAAYQQEKDDSN